MKILADENLEAVIVEWLRLEGHDLIWAAETLRKVPDLELMKQAQDESRIIITWDQDFGAIVFRKRIYPSGVLLLRYSGLRQMDRLQYLKKWWPQIQLNIKDHFLVLSDTQLRKRPLQFI